MTGEDLKDVQKVYWSLAALKASAADYRRLLAENVNESSWGLILIHENNWRCISETAPGRAWKTHNGSHQSLH
jgi:hypothetical protein